VEENALSAFHFIFAWAANIAVLAFVSRRPILWFFHVALMNATIVVFAATQLHIETNDFLYLILFFVSATGLLMRELFASEEKGTRILIRVVGVAGFGGDRSRPVRTCRWCGEMLLMIWWGWQVLVGTGLDLSVHAAGGAKWF
jgi:hypothetical protein